MKRRNPPTVPGDVEIVGDDVFDEGATAGPALDVDREGLGVGEFAVLDADVADAAGSLAADPDTGEDRIRQSAVGDVDVFAWFASARSLPSAAGLDGDAVVAGGDIAAVDADMLAGIDIDAVAVTAGAADGQVPDRDVFAVGGMDATTSSGTRWRSLRSGCRVQPMGSIRAGWRSGFCALGRPPSAALPMICPGRRCRCAGVDGVDEADVSRNPFAFPADLGHGVIGEVGCAVKMASLSRRRIVLELRARRR